MLDMVKKDIIPAVQAYCKELGQTAVSKASIGLSADLEKELITALSSLNACLYQKSNALENILLDSKKYTEALECAKYYKNTVFAAMQEVRAVADELEANTASAFWPFPTYGELLFNV